jgi:hypothetical protein
MILAVCDRFHCLPDVAAELDASVLRMLRVEALAAPDPPPAEGY